MRKTLASALLLFVALYLSDLSLSSCATRSSPGGGPRDTLAPQLDTSFPPNLKTHFEAEKVELIFNEYIVLKGGGSQIRFSPPLEKSPVIESSGKSIQISWEGDLRPNTTYTISFGEAISDFREGNVNNDFRYIFSTGDFIDSLSLSGTVVDAKSGEPLKEMLVALYEPVDSIPQDSLAFKTLPTYYAYTTEDGSYEMNYLKYGQFRLLTFKDASGGFKLKSGQELLGFASELIQTHPDHKPIPLTASQAPPPPRFLGARYLEQGHLQLSFNYNTDSLQIELPHQERLDTHFVQWNKRRDTMDLWFRPFLTDSLLITFNEQSLGQDTVIASLREMNPTILNLSVYRKEFRYLDTLKLKSNIPLSNVDASQIQVLTPKDTLTLAKDSLINATIIALDPGISAKKYRFIIPPSAVRSEFGEMKDTARLDLKSLSREELGSLNLSVKSDTSMPLVLVVETDAGREILRRSFRDSTTVDLRKRKPIKYRLKLISDRDENGEWSPADLHKNLQPEKILIYKEPLEIRANWEMDVEWKAQFTRARKPTTATESTDSTQSKNEN